MGRWTNITKSAKHWAEIDCKAASSSSRYREWQPKPNPQGRLPGEEQKADRGNIIKRDVHNTQQKPSREVEAGSWSSRLSSKAELPASLSPTAGTFISGGKQWRPWLAVADLPAAPTGIFTLHWLCCFPSLLWHGQEHLDEAPWRTRTAR